MSRLMSHDAGLQRTTDECEITDQVERFVAAILIWKAQRRIQQGSFVEHQSIGERTAPNQAHLLQLSEILDEAEGARGGQIRSEGLAIHGHFDFLRANSRMAVISE